MLILIEYLTILIILLYTIESIVVMLLLSFKLDKKQFSVDKTVSVLVAARNEEANILDCLQSLAQQNYPIQNYEVWIGDDKSEDATAAIVQKFILNYTNFHYLYIENDYLGIKGKQNVLAHLAHQAKGDLLLITDADIRHTPNWVAALVGAFDAPKIGIVSAPTLVEGKGLLSHMQTLDWLLGVSVIKAFAIGSLEVTAVGNNMAIRKDVYLALGGYENIPFSITEDYKLWEATLAQGWQWKWLFYPAVMNESKPIHGMLNLVRQRKRWFRGGSEGPWYAKLTFLLHALTAPACLYLCFSNTYWWEYYLALKIVADFIHLVGGAIVLKKTRSLWYFPIYFLYLNLSHLILPLYFLIPQKIIWKGRAY